MKQFSRIALLVLCGTLATPLLAAQASTPPTGCAAKRQEVQSQMDVAKAEGNQNQVAGLATALSEIESNCSDTSLQKSRENKVLEAKREVSKRQADLDKAMKKGDSEKINKRKDKLAESRKELQEAMDELEK